MQVLLRSISLQYALKGVGHLGHDEAMEAGGREFSLHGRVVKGVGHLGHDEAMEAGGREFSLHGRGG